MYIMTWTAPAGRIRDPTARTSYKGPLEDILKKDIRQKDSSNTIPQPRSIIQMYNSLLRVLPAILGRRSGTPFWDAVLGRRSGTPFWDAVLERRSGLCQSNNASLFYNAGLAPPPPLLPGSITAATDLTQPRRRNYTETTPQDQRPRDKGSMGNAAPPPLTPSRLRAVV